MPEGQSLGHGRSSLAARFHEAYLGPPAEVPWLEVHGSRSQSVDQAAAAVDGLLGGPAVAPSGRKTY
jgi:hypothetical protein